MGAPVPPQVSSLFYVSVTCSAECKIYSPEALAGCRGNFPEKCVYLYPSSWAED